MAINAYCGLMGSGKTFEAVVSLIIPAVASGRRVVSNIDGLNEEAIHAYVLAHKGKFGKSSRLTKDDLGAIQVVTNERVLEPYFFPDSERTDGVESVVHPGDFVVIDEAWRFWPGSGGKIPNEHKQFFKMHRHYVHPETGITSDLALIIQDISGLNRDLKLVVEMSCRTTKLKSLGLNSRYRVELFEGYRQTKTARTALYQKSYDKQIFPLYKSYAVDGAKEKSIDDRQNILKNPKIWFFTFLTLGCFFGGGYYVLNTFGAFGPKVKAAGTVSPLTVGSVSSSPGGKVAGEKPSPSVSSTWRISGTTRIDDSIFVVLKNGAGKLRYEHISNFKNRGPLMIGVVDGDNVTTYSGQSEVVK